MHMCMHMYLRNYMHMHMHMHMCMCMCMCLYNMCMCSFLGTKVKGDQGVVPTGARRHAQATTALCKVNRTDNRSTVGSIRP